jgi:hypothetical protein
MKSDLLYSVAMSLYKFDTLLGEIMRISTLLKGSQRARVLDSVHYVVLRVRDYRCFRCIRYFA